MKSLYIIAIIFSVSLILFFIFLLKGLKEKEDSFWNIESEDEQKNSTYFLKLFFLVIWLFSAIFIVSKIPNVEYLKSKEYKITDTNGIVYYVDSYSTNEDNTINFSADKKMLKILKIENLKNFEKEEKTVLFENIVVKKIYSIKRSVDIYTNEEK